jgi:hypothetical protein
VQERIEIDDKERIAQLRRAMDAELLKAEFEKRKEEVLHLLDRLGVATDGDVYGQEAIKDPLLYLNQVTDAMMSGDANGLVAYQQVRELCVGIGSIELISGRSNLSLTLDGLDIFDVLPAPPSFVDLLREINDLRIKRNLGPLKETNI